VEYFPPTLSPFLYPKYETPQALQNPTNSRKQFKLQMIFLWYIIPNLIALFSRKSASSGGHYRTQLSSAVARRRPSNNYAFIIRNEVIVEFIITAVIESLWESLIYHYRSMDLQHPIEIK
jgi:hypothetical protein